MLEWLKSVWEVYTLIMGAFAVLGLLALTGGIISGIEKLLEHCEYKSYEKQLDTMIARKEFMDKQMAERALNHQILMMQEWNY